LWVIFQGKIKNFFKVPFPHSGRLLRRILPPYYSRRTGGGGLQGVYNEWTEKHSTPLAAKRQYSVISG